MDKGRGFVKPGKHTLRLGPMGMRTLFGPLSRSWLVCVIIQNPIQPNSLNTPWKFFGLLQSTLGADGKVNVIITIIGRSSVNSLVYLTTQ